MSRPASPMANAVIYATKHARIQFAYTNWRGETSDRKVEVSGVIWGATEWHTEPQWLLDAFDLDKREHRLFAMRDMANVTSY